MHDCIWVLSICCSILFSQVLAWEDVSCSAEKQTAPRTYTLSSIPLAEYVHLLPEDQDVLCSQSVPFLLQITGISTINLKEPDVLPKHPICLSLVVKLFSGCFLRLSLILH